MKICRFVAAVLALLSIFAAAPASAAFIYTHPIEDVLPGASHVVLVKPPKEDDGSWEVIRIYRGKLNGTTLKIHRPPAPLFFTLRFPEVAKGFGNEVTIPVRVILALYEMDGRYHVIGQRPPHQITPHSATWLVDKKHRVFSYRQMGNPGSPIPVQAKPAKLEAFEKHLRELDEGPCISRNRDAILAAVKALDADLYTRSCQVLVALAKRKNFNEGLGAYLALKRNGEGELCEEIRKVWDAAEK